jgi:ATP-dependent Zn protease
MPHANLKKPVWTTLANTMIARLRRHHGMPQDHDDDSPTAELELLFAKLESGEDIIPLGKVPRAPSRYIPARQVLIAIRLAATFGSSKVVEQSLHCGALTVVRDVAVADLSTITDVLKICFGEAKWQIISPDTTDGGLAKSAQSRLEWLITESFDLIEPVLILQPGGVSLPKHLAAMAPTTHTMMPISVDIVTALLHSGHLSDQIASIDSLRSALPTDDALADLDTVTACAALRAPSLYDALIKLDAVTARNAHSSVPRLEDITGDSPALAAARRIVDDLVPWKKGKAGWDEISRSVLFYGPPGTGKTYLARAMGNSAGVSVVAASFGAWQSAGHLGDLLREMRASFAEARRKAPSFLIIDEIDAVGSRNTVDQHSSYRAQVINAFLAELDAISHEEGVILVGTTNHPSQMDPAVLRAGRIDMKVSVPLPDSEALLAILRHNLSEDIRDDELCALAPYVVGKSAADLDAAIRAARSDARHRRKPLDIAMLRHQLNINPATENVDRLWRIAVHEAGHAVMSAALELGAITSMQISDGGGRVYREALLHENLLSDYENEIAFALGGRAAERLLLSEISAGAGGPDTSDLAIATDYAIRIETTLGLGFEGPVWHADPESVHLSTPGIRDRVRQRIEQAEQRAGKVLTLHRDTLEALARDLLENRSLRAAQIELRLRGVHAVPEKKTTNALRLKSESAAEAPARAQRDLPHPA